MVQTDFTRMRCPVARSMAVLGERWAILVLREAFYGTRRFDDFQRHLGIAPNILSARLRRLVEHGLLERAPRPGHAGGGGGGHGHDYVLTAKGRDFFPAYLALKRWGDRWMADPAGPVVLLVDRATGAEIAAPLPRRPDGAPLAPEDLRVLPGPGASPAMRRRFAAATAEDAAEDARRSTAADPAEAKGGHRIAVIEPAAAEDGRASVAEPAEAADSRHPSAAEPARMVDARGGAAAAAAAAAAAPAQAEAGRRPGIATGERGRAKHARR